MHFPLHYYLSFITYLIYSHLFPLTLVISSSQGPFFLLPRLVRCSLEEGEIVINHDLPCYSLRARTNLTPMESPRFPDHPAQHHLPSTNTNTPLETRHCPQLMHPLCGFEHPCQTPTKASRKTGADRQNPFSTRFQRELLQITWLPQSQTLNPPGRKTSTYMLWAHRVHSLA